MGDGWAAERGWERLCFGRELLEVWVEAMVCVCCLFKQRLTRRGSESSD